MRAVVADIFQLRSLLILARLIGIASIPVLAATWSHAGADAHPTIPPDWEFKPDGTSDSSPAVAPDGTVYIGSFKGNLWAVAPSGTPKWQFSTGMEIRSSPAVARDGTVYVGCRNRRLYAISPDGHANWEFKTGGWVDASPAIASDGAILIGSWDGYFYSVDPRGAMRWKFRTAGPIVSSAAVATNGAICFGSHDGFLYSLTPEGRERWRFKTAGAILSSPALDAEENVYFTSVDGNLYSLNAAGELRWKVRVGSMGESSPVIGQGGEVFLGTHGAIWSVALNGQAKRVSCENETVDGSPVVSSSGEIIFVFRNGQACAYTHGLEYRWRSVVLSAGGGGPAISPQGKIYVSGLVNNLVAIPHEGRLAATAWPKYRGNLRNTGNCSDNDR